MLKNKNLNVRQKKKNLILIIHIYRNTFLGKIVTLETNWIYFCKLKKLLKIWKSWPNFQNQKIEYIYIP
jgi:hypothetical protein